MIGRERGSEGFRVRERGRENEKGEKRDEKSESPAANQLTQGN